MKESLKRRLNVFLKLRRQLASIKWVLLFITTVVFFLSAASNACTFSFGGSGPTVQPSSGQTASGVTSPSPPSTSGSPSSVKGSPPSITTTGSPPSVTGSPPSVTGSGQTSTPAPTSSHKHLGVQAPTPIPTSSSKSGGQTPTPTPTSSSKSSGQTPTPTPTSSSKHSIKKIFGNLITSSGQPPTPAPTSSSGKIVTVEMVSGVNTQSGCGFSPESVTIQEGDTVIWRNTTSASHTVTSDGSGGPLKSPQVGLNGTYSFKFNTAGTFKYHCDSHPTQGGTIVVTA